MRLRSKRRKSEFGSELVSFPDLFVDILVATAAFFSPTSLLSTTARVFIPTMPFAGAATANPTLIASSSATAFLLASSHTAAPAAIASTIAFASVTPLGSSIAFRALATPTPTAGEEFGHIGTNADRIVFECS